MNPTQVLQDYVRMHGYDSNKLTFDKGTLHSDFGCARIFIVSFSVLYRDQFFLKLRWCLIFMIYFEFFIIY